MNEALLQAKAMLAVAESNSALCRIPYLKGEIGYDPSVGVDGYIAYLHKAIAEFEAEQPKPKEEWRRCLNCHYLDLKGREEPSCPQCEKYDQCEIVLSEGVCKEYIPMKEQPKPERSCETCKHRKPQMWYSEPCSKCSGHVTNYSLWQPKEPPAEKPEVITLCGSTRFKQEFIEMNRLLTNKGKIVLSVGVFPHSGEPVSYEEKEKLDELRLRKIDISDSIYVLNIRGYIGASTEKEIEYAEKWGKKIYYHTSSKDYIPSDFKEPEKPAEKPKNRDCKTCKHDDDGRNKFCKLGLYFNADAPCSVWEKKEPTEAVGMDMDYDYRTITIDSDGYGMRIKVSEDNNILGSIRLSPETFAKWLDNCRRLLPVPDEAPKCKVVSLTGNRVELLKSDSNAGALKLGNFFHDLLDAEGLFTLGKTCFDLARWIKEKGAK